MTSLQPAQRRREAALRLPPLARCGCIRDPEACVHRCGREPLTEKYVDGYSDAGQHLLDRGLTPAPNLPAMRVLWRRCGEDQRLAREISEPWETAT